MNEEFGSRDLKASQLDYIRCITLDVNPVCFTLRSGRYNSVKPSFNIHNNLPPAVKNTD